MIFKTLILLNNKLISTKFSINKLDNKLIINIIQNNTINDNIIKIPIYNKYNGLYYESIIFPITMIINKNYVFNPYLILTLINIKKNNELDYLYNLELFIYNNYNLKFYNIYNLLYQKSIFLHIINTNYIIDLDKLFIHKKKKLSDIKNNLWNNLYIIKIYIIFIIYNFKKLSIKNIIYINKLYKIPFYLLILAYIIKLFNLHDNIYNFLTNIDIVDIIFRYIIIINNIQYYKLNNIINIIIFYFKYTKILYLKNNKIFINKYLYKLIKLKIINVHSERLIEYYTQNNKLSNLKDIFKNKLNNFYILKNNLFDNKFYYYITKKYETTPNIIKILIILFKNFNYPLKINKQELDITFDYIIYISLYNYKYILNNLHNINIIIPYKIKKLYNIIFKILIQLINNIMTSLIYNYNINKDYIYQNIIKLFLFNYNKTSLSINYFQSLISPIILNKAQLVIITSVILYDISNKITWNNVLNKLNYLNLHYIKKNENNILFNNLDLRLKVIIKDQFIMYKYLIRKNIL